MQQLDSYGAREASRDELNAVGVFPTVAEIRARACVPILYK